MTGPGALWRRRGGRDVGSKFLETLRFLRMVAAMRNADGRWCTPEEALVEVERLAG